MVGWFLSVFDEVTKMPLDEGLLLYYAKNQIFQFFYTAFVFTRLVIFSSRRSRCPTPRFLSLDSHSTFKSLDLRGELATSPGSELR